MSSTCDMKKLLDENLEEIKKRDEKIQLLENAVKERELIILDLQNEIDKFRQIVDLGKITVPKERLKKLAISAEPLGINSEPLTKFIKPQR